MLLECVVGTEFVTPLIDVFVMDHTMDNDAKLLIVMEQ